jgi:HprK-related kinase A
MRLTGPGLFLRTASFVTQLQSPIPSVLDGLALLYADYPVIDDGGYADFHVRIAPPANPRRWFRPQVHFFLDGRAPFKPLPFDQAPALFEWGLNYCVSNHCHQYLVIHAAVIERQGRAVILPAPPGAGKSTLCAGLVNRGWRLLSDELTLVRLLDGQIDPFPRPVSLKNKSIDIVREFAPTAVIGPRVHDTSKGTVAHMKAPADSVARAGEIVRPAWVIFPQYQPDAPTQLTRLPKTRAFMRVAENTFNYSLLGAKGFNTLAGLIDASDSFELRYSQLEEAIALFADLQG